VAEWSLAPIVTAEIGLRAGDEMAARPLSRRRRDLVDAWSVIR
jgi:hypothetical protein